MFETSLPLRFAHCDPAGIAYYPRYFELCDAAIEDWTTAVLGIDRRTMHQGMGLGLPTVTLHAEFAAPSRLGDRLDFAVTVTRVGQSSIDLAVDISCASEQRFSVRYTQVLTDLAKGASRIWPPQLLDRLNKELS
jgi:4-hydroxybenzoyl-CoA thioesterase